MTDASDQNPRPEALLTNIIALTEQRDQLSLEHSLFMALEDILEPVALLMAEWTDGNPTHRVVRESVRRFQPSATVMAQARQAGEDFRPLGRVDGLEWLVMGVAATGNEAQRVLVLGLDDAHPDVTGMARGMLRVYQNFMRLLNDSEKDTLTGLMNRRRLEKDLCELLGARREGRRGDDHLRRDFLALVDIDHFKSVNDRHGHLVGDEVLLRFSNILRESLRDRDRCYRFGGEEFIVLLSDLGREQALMVLERLRSRVASQEFPSAGHLTISIGLAQIDSQNLPEKIVGQADQALYYAKNPGRDQLQEYQTLSAGQQARTPPESPPLELF